MEEMQFAGMAIEKMFHQVRVRLKDIDVLHSLWKANSQDYTKAYVMLVHIFGNADSSSCVNWVLQKNNPKNVPDVKHVIDKDDFSKSLSNVGELIKLFKRIISTFLSHRFLNSCLKTEKLPKLVILDLLNPTVERVHI